MIRIVDAGALKVIYEANKHRICDDAKYTIGQIDTDKSAYVEVEYCDLRHLRKVSYRYLTNEQIIHFKKLT